MTIDRETARAISALAQQAVLLVEAWVTAPVQRRLVVENGRVWLRLAVPLRLPPPGPLASRSLLQALADHLGRSVYPKGGYEVFVLLYPPPRPLPDKAVFDGVIREGEVRIGVSVVSEVSLPLKGHWHASIVGMTRFGKSNLVRLIALQAYRQGWEVIFSDLGQADIAECTTRARTVEETIEVLTSLCDKPREALVIVDEANAQVSQEKEVGRLLNVVAWTLAQKGVHLLLCSQDPVKAVMASRATDQTAIVIAFRMANAAAARTIGLPEAAQLPPIPGRFVTNLPCRLGQAYFLE